MQKNFKTLAVIIIGMTLLLLTSCPQPQQKKGYEGTKLVVPQWPEHIEHVQLSFENSTWSLNCYKAATCEGCEYFTGNAILTIYYSRIDSSESDQYFGYGIRSNAKNQFKIFVNGEEMEDESPQATYTEFRTGDEIELNANIDYFRTTFNVTNVKNVVVTFENSPEKILNKDIRVYADTNYYAYIDTDDLKERFSYISIMESVKNGGTDSYTWYDFERLAKGGLYYFNRGTLKFYIQLKVKDGYYIQDRDYELYINSNKVPATITSDNTSELYDFLEIWISNPNDIPPGSVVTVKGGTIVSYDESE